MRIKETGIGSAQLAGSKRWGTIAWAFREGTGNPLQYSCLENPKDSGAWWAAIYGVAQSWTRLKRLSSSSSSRMSFVYHSSIDI